MAIIDKPEKFEHGSTVREPPCVMVIFGGAGDLSHRKLLPALYNLTVDHELHERVGIVAFSMEDLDDERYRAWAREGIEKYSRRPLDEANWQRFAPMLHFVRGRFTEAGDFQALKARLEEFDHQLNAGGNRVFYFAIPPGFIDTCSEGLRRAGMIRAPEDSSAFTRVVVEKPIGHDLLSAA